TAGDADYAEGQDDDNFVSFEIQQKPEIENDDHGDEGFQEAKEFALGGEIGFAGFVDQLRHFAHGIVHRQVAQAKENDQAKDQAGRVYHEAAHEQAGAGDAAQDGYTVRIPAGNGTQVGQLQVG